MAEGHSDVRERLAWYARRIARRGRDPFRRAYRALEAEGPSFVAKFESSKRVRMLLQSEWGMRHEIWGYNSKPAGRELATSVGVEVPELLVPPRPLSDMAAPAADRFVLKPVNGTSSTAVLLLSRYGEDTYELPDGRRLSWDEVRKEASTYVEREVVSPEFFIEQLVETPDPSRIVPYDYKCFCIGGKVEVVVQKAPGAPGVIRHSRYKYWSRSWESLGPIHMEGDIDVRLPAPVHGNEIVIAAEAVARALPSIFVRVDLYDGRTGAVFGEITPHPGGNEFFFPEWDRRLGEAWERAEATEYASRHPERCDTKLVRRASSAATIAHTS